MTPHAAHNEAVSSVVSAVLIFALFTSVFVLYTIQTLPQWEADNEHAHQRLVQQNLGALKSDLEGLSGRKDPGPITASIPLGTPPVALLQTVPASGVLDIQSGTNGLTTALTFGSTPALFLTDGAAVSQPTTPIATAPCAGACIQVLEAFVLGIGTTGVTGAGAQATLTVTVTDSAATPNTITAILGHYATGASCAGEVRLAVGAQVSTLLCGSGATLASSATPYRADLLNPLYGFSAALGRLQAPYAISMATATAGSARFAASQYTAVFQDLNALEQATGSGIANNKPVADLLGNRLVFTPRYQHFPSQTLSLEGGAVVSNDGIHQAVAVDPSFQLKVMGGIGYVRWTLVQLTGTGSLSGNQDATVALTHQASQDLLLKTPATCNPCATFSLTTPTATGWNSFFAAHALAAAAGTSAIAGTTSPATLTLNSGAGQPVTAGWVLHVRIIQGDAKVS